ncbi:MAG: ComEC family competence protein [Bacteroidetes bacterium]|nr:ComEC family competence protein [Bacteroidota bacterium]
MRLLSPFIVGIIAAIYSDINAKFLIQLMMITLVCMTFWIIKNPRKANYSNRWFFGVLGNVFLVLMGINIVNLNKINHDPLHFSNFGNEKFLATVADLPREKEHSWKVILNVNTVIIGNRSKAVRGKLLTYFAKDSLLKIPCYGDLFIFQAKIIPVPLPQNPGSFNYKRYLEHTGIYHQVYLRRSEWKLLKSYSGLSLKSLSLRIRAYSMGVLQRSNLDGKELAIASALLLGQDEVLDSDTRSEFSSAGVVHILGISGLHVGIIYLVLNFFLRFLDKRRNGLIAKQALVILLIWFYALVTGLSPAALRSAAMFSFVSLGNLGKRNVHIINSLATSALVLLLYDPFLVTNIGFQFSYIAVIGIILFHPTLYGIWQSRFWLLNQAWNLTAMSLAAQFVTLPITLYYFHQFPVYFLPANLIAIPLSNLIIYTGMAVLGTSFLPLLSYWLGSLTSLLIRILGISIHFIERFPLSVIRDIPYDLPNVLSYYLLIGICILYIKFRKKSYIYSASFVILALVSWNTYQKIRIATQEKFVVYSFNKYSALGLISGSKCLLLADSAILLNTRLKALNIHSSDVYLGIQTYNELSISNYSSVVDRSVSAIVYSQDSVLYLRKSKFLIAIISGHPSRKITIPTMQLDALVVRNNAIIPAKELVNFYKIKVVILDTSNNYATIKKWRETCWVAGIQLYDVRSSGAYISDFSNLK